MSKTPRFVLSIFLTLIAMAADRHVSADLLVSDNFGNQVIRYSSTDGSFIGTTISSNPSLNGGLAGPVGMLIAPNGELLVASQSTNQVLRYNAINGNFLGVFAETDLSGPSHMEFHPVTGNLLVSNFSGNSITAFDSNGTSLGSFTSGGALNGISSFAFDGAGNLYAGSFGTGAIQVFNTNGAYQNDFGSGGFLGASGLVFDNNQLWVASLLTGQVSRLNADGSLDLTITTNGQGLPQADANGTFPTFILPSSPFGSDEVIIALAGSFGAYRFGLDGGLRGTFIAGGGLQVPGEMLQVSAIPEPTTLVPLGMLATGYLVRRRRRAV